MSDTQTKIAIITGGSRGLGRNTALAVAARGIDVIFTYRTNKAEAEKVATEIKASGRKALALQLDTGDSASFPAFVETIAAALRDTWGRTHFDYLVNNAGSGLYRPFGQTDLAEEQRLLELNVVAVMVLSHASVRSMTARGTGRHGSI